jgi:cobalt-zinc-cadmium efflux system protein
VSHDHHHHDTSQKSDVRLLWAVGVNVLLTVAQIVGGVLSGSLALVADALHNLNDAASLGLALLARRIARKPADRKRTFGYRKAELIGALINLTTLIIVGLYLAYEAVWRFFDPQPVAGWIVVILAGIALCIDIITALLTFALSKDNLNVKAAFVHNLSDAFASVAVIIAGTLILLYEWYWADWVATLIISGYILWHGAIMMRSTIRILMDSVPEDIDLDDLVAAMEAVEHVEQVHHVHVWQLDEHHRAMEAHVVVPVDAIGQMESIKDAIRALLASDFDIVHSTLELETANTSPHATQVIVDH